jgi:hypothetical protein
MTSTTKTTVSVVGSMICDVLGRPPPIIFSDNFDRPLRRDEHRSPARHLSASDDAPDRWSPHANARRLPDEAPVWRGRCDDVPDAPPSAVPDELIATAPKRLLIVNPLLRQLKERGPMIVCISSIRYVLESAVMAALAASGIIDHSACLSYCCVLAEFRTPRWRVMPWIASSA